MLWNLEIYSGKGGKKLETRHEAVRLEPKTFDIPTKKGMEFGFCAFGSTGLIDRIGLATINENERLLTTLGTMTVRGISIALIDVGSRIPQDEEREYAYGIFEEEDLLRSLEIPELHRQWTLTADFDNTARILEEYAVTGNNFLP